MATATATEPATGPILIDLDGDLWDEQLDRAGAWFGNVLMAQATYRKMAEDAAASFHEPHIQKYLGDVAAKAKEHEGAAADLFRAIGRDPARGRVTGGVVHAKLQRRPGRWWAGSAAGPAGGCSCGS